MAGASYSVRDVDPREAVEDLVRLWKANLNMRGDPRHKHDWFYVGNPRGTARAFLLEHRDEDGQAAVVGCCGVTSRLLHLHGQPVEAGLLADFAVDRAHRTALPALILQRALAAHARARFSMIYGFPNDGGVGIFTRIGYRLLGRSGRYVKLLRHGPFLERYLKWPWLARLAALVPDAAVRLADSLRAARAAPHLRLEWLEQPDERFDRLWQKARAAYRCLGDRSASFLRWRFTERPGLRGELAALVDPSTGEIRAYAAVTQKVPGVALIADFLAEDERTLGHLLHRLFPVLRARGFSSATTFYVGASRIEKLLNAHGLSFRNPTKYLMLQADAGRSTDGTFDKENWYVTEADRDN